MCRHWREADCPYCRDTHSLAKEGHTRDVASFCEARQQSRRRARIKPPKGRYGNKWVGKLYAVDPSDRRSGTSQMVMPDDSVVCVAHDTPFELAASMSIEVIRAWTEALTAIVNLEERRTA